MRWTPVLGLFLAALPVRTQQGQSSASVLTVGAQSFSTWQDYVRSGTFQKLGLRCGLSVQPPPGQFLRPPGDCTISSTTIQPQYDAQGHELYQIPVVVHILEHSSGVGQLTNAMVRSQIEVLNEDFRATPGTLGENGHDARIHFYLANQDPLGNPTSGITRSVNDDWFMDTGDYWIALAWDTTRYLNIYTNNASGYLGYVPNLPQGGAVGQDWDRVVVLWSAFGRNAPIGPPYDLGRTATHEIGHYLGLYHPFSGGCADPGSCYENGDLICDTNPEQVPVFGCPASSASCGLPDPFHNYMDYSDDSCYEEFTPEQVNRMRCTISQWRPDLPEALCSAATAVPRSAPGNPDAYFASAPVIGQNFTVQVVAFTHPKALVIGRAAPANVTLPNGKVLLIDGGSPVFFRKFLTLPFGQSTIALPNDLTLCAIPAYSQAVLFGGGIPYELTNAMDLTAGF